MRFCRDMLQETMREATLIGVAYAPEQDQMMEIDVHPQSNETSDDVASALKELRDRMASVKIG